MTGKLTTKRYKHATVYVLDQRSRFGYVRLQKTSSAEETIVGKRAFETYARRHGITVKNYLADNGIFKANLWVEECKKQGQGLTFAGVNAHHQNGVAERRICELQDMARTMLIHANSRWSESVTTNLWPYAIRMANEAINNTPSFQDEDGKTPVELFANSKVTANLNTGSRSVAQYTYWTTHFNPASRFTSGKNGARWRYTWVRRHNMDAQWPLC